MKTNFTNNGCLGVETSKIDNYMLRYGLTLEEWFIDDTIHLCAWYLRNNRWYHVAIFGNPFSDKYYISVKCGNCITKINIRNFKALNNYQNMDTFISSIEK